MKLCFVTDFYPTVGPAGGIGVYTRTAARALAERGHEVHILVGHKTRGFDTQDGRVLVHVRFVRWIPILGRWLTGLGESCCLAWALFFLQRRHHFDVVEFPNWEGYGFVAALLHICPIVVRLHTSTLQSVRSHNRPLAFSDRFMIWIEKMSARWATSLVTHSEFHRQAMEVEYGLRNIHVIPHGVIVPEPSSSPQSLAVLSVGLSIRKSIKTLCAAIPLVLERVPESEFWLAGADLNRQTEKAFWDANSGISPNKVRFLGVVTDKQLDDLYSTCAVYASASVYESFGLTLVEAMAHERAVVGCAAGAVQETVLEGKTGFLVPVEDSSAFATALIRLLRDKDLRSRYGQAGRQRVIERFSIERMAENIEAYFATIA